MPTLSVKRDVLFAHLGRTYTDEEFDELCFEFGVELDEITSEREEALKPSTVKLTQEEINSLDNDVIYKIDVPANRYDLLCAEGLSRALKVFLRVVDAPTYVRSQPEQPSGMEVMNVMRRNTQQVRPFVVCAILRNITFTHDRYHSFIDLQDQLHRNLCRQRTLVAIGTHDYDAVRGPFVYDARRPEEIEFVPLTHDATGEKFAARALLDLYENDPSCKHLKPYVPIIRDSPLYPVIYDADGTVLSLPPIINGARSKIKLETTNVFVECTATDLTKANVVLDTVVTMFSEYCSPRPFVVEPVLVNYLTQQEGGGKEIISASYITPELATRKMTASVDFINSMIGIDIAPETMVDLCNRIQLGPAALRRGGGGDDKSNDDDTGDGTAADDDDGNDTLLLEVTVPPTRSDVLHPVDIAEDVGIAYGYNNIVKHVPTTSTVGCEQPLNQLSDLLREEIARAGYTEVLTHGLCSRRDNFAALRKRKGGPAVSLSNPANVEYEVVRTSLLPGLLKTCQHNKAASFGGGGWKLFEISDVVLPDDTHEICETIVGARNVRRVCAIYVGPTSGFEIIHGLADRIMTLCEVSPRREYVEASGKADEEKFRVSREGWFYTIRELEDSHENAGTYFPGRAAEVLLTRPNRAEDLSIGTFGILHPEVLANFEVSYPASCIELDLEALL